MKNYYRVMPGQKSIHAEECFIGNFIGTDFGITVSDLLFETENLFLGQAERCQRLWIDCARDRNPVIALKSGQRFLH